MPSIPYQRRDEQPRMYLTFYIDFNGLITFKMQAMRRYLDNQCPYRDLNTDCNHSLGP